MVLPMNSGAEAVESGLKVARKWGADVKGVPAGRANIIVADNNFHGARSASSASHLTDGAGRVRTVHAGVSLGAVRDSAALARAIDANTVAVLLEPIQGEAGVVVPPDDYLPAVRALCSERNVLMIADEIQSGWPEPATRSPATAGRCTRRLPARKGTRRRVVPLSAVVADREILGVLHPGEHGSTFGGNPLATAIGSTVVAMLSRGEFQRRSAELGAHLHRRLGGLIGDGVLAVRGFGLWAGVDIEPTLATGKEMSLLLADRGVLVKDTTIRRCGSRRRW